MHLFQVAFYGAGVFYALFIDRVILIPFFVIVALYLVASALLPRAKPLSTRKKIMQATWGHPNDPNIITRVVVRTQKVEKIIAELPKQSRISMTHFCIKAVGEVLAAQPFLNGILTFGKFVPRETVDVSCLVDIGGGKDLALLCVKGVDKMSIEDIADFLNTKARNMKRNDGGAQHKKQTGLFGLMPAFMVGFFTEVISFIGFRLRVKIPMLSVDPDSLGSGCVTSIGSLGFQDATAPFSPFANWSLLLAANAIAKQPVVEDDKVVVGRVMNCNFVVDHRYIDGGNCTKLVPAFKSVFEEPEKYMDKFFKNKKQ